MTSARMTGACVRNLREIPQPVIASVNGIAAGAGASWRAAADLRILAESASFDFSIHECWDFGRRYGCQLVVATHRRSRAGFRMLLLGGKVTSQGGGRLGPGHQVVSDDQLDAVVTETRPPQGTCAVGPGDDKRDAQRAASSDYSAQSRWTPSPKPAHDRR